MVLIKEKYESVKAEEDHARGVDSKHDNFSSILRQEVDKFNRSFGFNIKILSEDPSLIDDAATLTGHVFILIRDDALLSLHTYCLYAILNERALHGYIGIYKNHRIKTVKYLKPLRDFREVKDILYEWLRQLLKVSFEKITL